MRLVLDTNTVISGLLWKGPPHTLLTAAREDPSIQLHSSPRLLAELADVLGRRKFGAAVSAGRVSPDALLQRYLSVVNTVVPAPSSDGTGTGWDSRNGIKPGSASAKVRRYTWCN